MPDVGTGSTIAFGTSAFTAEIMNINGNDMFSREDIDTTHMGTTGYRTYMPSDLVEGGTVDFEFAFDPDEQPPIGAAETITITFPIAAGNSSGATLVFTGYIKTWSFSDPLEEKMTANATIKVDGMTDPVWTDGA